MLTTRTKLLYQTNTYKQEHITRIIFFASTDTQDAGSRGVKMVCEETIFHPQGGGQPTDLGVISSLESMDQACDIKFVSYDRQTGVVSHEGVLRCDGSFGRGQMVRMEVDWTCRYLHMRLHSGGHAIDHAVQFLGCPFKALKANHFPSGPAVEFEVLDSEAFKTDRASLDVFMAALQAKVIEVIKADMNVRVFEEEPGQADSSVADTHTEKAKDVKANRVRMILFEGCPAAVPCGGTHVARAGEIGHVLIKKVTYKSSVLRISYALQDSI